MKKGKKPVKGKQVVKKNIKPQLSKEDTAKTPASDKYQIVRSFSVGSTIYNVGEAVPPLPEDDLERLYRTGRIGRVVNGEIIIKVEKVHRDHAWLEALARAPYSSIRWFLNDPATATTDIDTLLDACLKQRRPENIVTLVMTELEKRKSQEKEEIEILDKAVDEEVCPDPAPSPVEILDGSGVPTESNEQEAPSQEVAPPNPKSE